MPLLEQPHPLDVQLPEQPGPVDIQIPALDEAAGRRDLREQIARLERRVAEALATDFPNLRRRARGSGRRTAGRLLSFGELEQVRDELADQLHELRREAEELGARQNEARELLERMRLEPGRHRWVRVYAADLGEPGCQSWQVRPRLGLLGMLMGWWRVKLSSGCPLPAA